MRNLRFLLPALFLPIFVYCQSARTLHINKEQSGLVLIKDQPILLSLQLKAGGIYQFSVLQQGIAIAFVLTDKDKNILLKSNSPEDITGYMKGEYSAVSSGEYFLKIERFNHPENTDSGQLTIYVKSLSKKEITARNKIKAELAPENSKNVLTLDIDHFWEAFDNLKTCKKFSDSVQVIQQYYLDRATNGLLDFIKVRDFTAENFVATIGRYPKFYHSIRTNTFAAKNAEPAIDSIFTRFKAIYPNFKPFKVCFAIGIANTGGTVSDQFVLIGTEIATATHGVDNSDFVQSGETAKADLLAGQEDLIQKIKNMVAHECVHTQQKISTDSAAINCKLLHKVIQEGSCDFIGKLVSGDQINTAAQEYGDAHEAELWAELKNELCTDHLSNWVYNASRVKDKPADLGYYMGYKIAEAYYNQATNKSQAIIDIIEMTNPIQFLERSRYEQKPKD